MNFKIFISGICIEFRFFAEGYLYRVSRSKNANFSALNADLDMNNKEVQRVNCKHTRGDRVFPSDGILEFFKARDGERNE